MPLFTRRDRIAIACIAGFILIGWGVRLFLTAGSPEDVRLIRGAVNPSQTTDSLTVKKAGEPSVVDINTADTALLETLPMIGEVKASAIIRYREKNGRFSKPADIMKVNGIGPGTYERIKDFITVGNP